MKIMMATGGSGGHIFPALKTACRLKAQGHEVILIGALSSAHQRLQDAGLSFMTIDVEGLKKTTPAALCSFALLMIKSCVRSWMIVRAQKPDRVVGFGSYSSFPVILAAFLAKVPTLVHEQNVVPGKANRWSFRLARRVAVTFQETSRFIPPGREIIWTGCPCNNERPDKTQAELLERFQLKPNRVTILVLGGSQGSRRLNEVVFESIPYLQAERDIQVIHMTGRTDYSLYAGQYERLNVPYCVCEFIENIHEAYSVADLVIARAGAGTVCEIASFGRPAVLVPYPFAGAHQTANAKILEGNGTACIIQQSDLTRAALCEAAGRLLSGADKSAGVQRVAMKVADHAAERLSEAIVNLKS